jgi:ABC-2 type transport system permease protein
VSAALAGTGALIRFGLRRDRVAIPVFVVLLALLVAVTAAESEALYATQAERDAYAASMAGNAGMIALVGPAHALDTVGGDTAWQTGGFGSVIAALVTMFLLGRHTRAEEQNGQAELLLSHPVGRAAPAVAGLVVVALADVLAAAAVALCLIVQDLDAEGAIALGASIGAVGLVFAGVAAVAAQVSQTTSGMYGLTGAALGAAYLLRAIGDVGDGTLSWLSPVGWGQAMRPFAGERWWPLLLALAAAALLVAVAFALLARRDVGAGVLGTRPGPPRAAAWMTRPVGLTFRLQRGTLAGWTLGLFLSGLSVGAIAQDADAVLGDSEAVDDIFRDVSGTLVENYLAIALLFLAQIGAAYAVQVLLRLRSEERDGRAEPLLATALSRWRWAGAATLVAFGGVVLVVGVSGLGAGIADAIVTDDPGRVPELLAASLVAIPAVWVVAGFTVLLYGAAPRFAMVAWVAVASGYLLGILGPLLSLPQWVLDISPYEHLPKLPADDFRLEPLVWLTVVAAALTAAGFVALRRRDVGSV